MLELLINKKKKGKNIPTFLQPTRNLSYEATNYLLLQRFEQRVMDQN